MRDLPGGTRLLWGVAGSGEYPALVGPGLLDHAEPEVAGRRFIVADATVASLYGPALEGAEAVVRVPPGEGSKTLAEAERVLGELARAGARRDDHLAALGGGVVGDLAGFCAAVYQRGVPVVQLPTTLVAQVDSAYGGKTGVDIPEAKNYVGAFQQPAAVIADTETLRTLPEADLAAGFVEVLKAGLIAGGELWERARRIEALDVDSVAPLIPPSIELKLAIVAADEREAGRRAALNLGHTVGHAIEAASGYSRYRHGEAVGLGLLAALRLSEAGGAARGGARDPGPPRPGDRARSGDLDRCHPRGNGPRQEADGRGRGLRPLRAPRRRRRRSASGCALGCGKRSRSFAEQRRNPQPDRGPPRG